MKKLSFAYFGSAYFSALLLEKLINDSELQKIIDEYNAKLDEMSEAKEKELMEI